MKTPQELAEALFHTWANLPDYEPMDEEMAISLVCRIRDAIKSAHAQGLAEGERKGMRRARAIAWNHDAGKVALQMIDEAIADSERKCPTCGAEMQAVTSRTPEGAWKCGECESG